MVHTEIHRLDRAVLAVHGSTIPLFFGLAKPAKTRVQSVDQLSTIPLSLFLDVWSNSSKQIQANHLKLGCHLGNKPCKLGDFVQLGKLTT